MLLELPERNMKRIMPLAAVSDIQPPFSRVPDFPVLSDPHDPEASNHSRESDPRGSSPRNKNHEVLFDLPHPPFAFKPYFTYHSQKGDERVFPCRCGSNCGFALRCGAAGRALREPGGREAPSACLHLPLPRPGPPERSFLLFRDRPAR